MEIVVKHGLVSAEDADWSTLKQLWESASQEASNLYAAGKKVTPWDFVSVYAGANGLGGQDASGKPKTTTSMSKTIPYQDPAALRDLIRSSVADKLGRAPEDDELDDMMHIAQTYQSSAGAHIEKATQTTKGNHQTTTNRTVQGGATAEGTQEQVDNSIMEKPEYASYQAATTYMNALTTALQSPVDLPDVAQ